MQRSERALQKRAFEEEYTLLADKSTLFILFL